MNLVKSIPVIAILAFCVILPSQVSAQRIKLESRMEGIGLTDGKAKFEARRDRRKFSVELEDSMANELLVITLHRQAKSQTLGTVRTNAAGFADFNLDSRLGQAVGMMRSGDLIRVTGTGGKLVASGQLRQRK